jgi:hypothetical protein
MMKRTKRRQERHSSKETGGNSLKGTGKAFLQQLAVLLVALLTFASLSGAGEKALIIDYMMSDPILFRPFFQYLPQKGLSVEYRRYYPSLVKSDSAYNVIVLGAGRHPHPSPSKMVLAEKVFLREYVRNGGVLVALFSSEENDRVVLNQLLEELSLPVRIEGRYIHDMVKGYKSTLIPSSYFLDLPLLNVYHGTPLGKGVSRIYGGRAISLLISGGDNIAVPVTSFETSLRFNGFNEKAGIKDAEGLFLGGPYGHGVVAVGRAGKGFVLLLPRYLLNMNGYTGKWSDKPVLPTTPLKENETFERNLMEYIAGLAQGNNIFRPFNPLSRWDDLKNYPAKAEKVKLETGEVASESPPGVADHLRYDPSRKRVLETDNTVYRKLHKKKFKTAFIQNICGAANNPSYLERVAKSLSEMGFNMVEGMIQDCAYDGMKGGRATPEFLADMRAALRIFEKHGVAVVAGTNIPNRHYFEKKPYSKVTTVDGVEKGSPSPLDRELWKDSVLSLALELARLSGEFPATLIGSFWDLELYGFESLIVTEAFSFDNVTYNEFLTRREALLKEMKVLSKARLLPQYLRFAWLKEQGLLGEYYRSLEEGMEDIGRWLNVEVEAVNRGFMWGFYVPGIPQGWYYSGLFRGLSSPRKPVFLVTYDTRGLQQVDYNYQKGIYLIHCPGMLLNALAGTQWIESLTGLASAEDGYWLFPGGSLVMDQNWRYGRHDWSILQSPQELHAVLKKANARIKGDESP